MDMQIRREVTKTVQVTEAVEHDAEFDLDADNKGRVYLLINGHRVLQFTRDGYMRRLRELPPEIGFRRLPDGRIAIKPKKNGNGVANEAAA